jgi:HlyD family secretion protein
MEMRRRRDGLLTELKAGTARVLQLGPRRRVRWLLAPLLGVVAVVVASLAGNRSAAPGVPVRVAPVRTGGFAVDVVASGSVELTDEVSICGRADLAFVDEVMVKVGDSVQPGTPLLRLDPGLLQQAVYAARSAHLRAQEKLAEGMAGVRGLEIQQLEIGVDRAQVDLEFKKARTLETEKLANEGLVPRVDLARASNDEALAGMALQEARLKLLAAQRRLEVEQIDALRSEVALKKLVLDESVTQAREATIVAPGAGSVLSIAVKPGTAIRKGDLVLRIGSPGRFRVGALVDELEAGRLRTGLPVSVTGEFFGATELKGTVERIEPVVNTERGASSVKAMIVLAETGFRPPAGLSVDVRIHLAQAVARSVPLEALVQRSGKSALFVVEQGRARMREVNIGLRSDREAEVLGGLNDGDEVVIRGQNVLEGGERVDIRTSDARSGLTVDILK